MLYESIKKLVQYGINTGLTPETERIYTTNLLLDLFREDNYEDADAGSGDIVLEDVLRGIEALQTSDIPRIKLNCVPMEEINGDELARLAALAAT